mgnify:CR=1 FL=1
MTKANVPSPYTRAREACRLTRLRASPIPAIGGELEQDGLDLEDALERKLQKAQVTGHPYITVQVGAPLLAHFQDSQPGWDAWQEFKLRVYHTLGVPLTALVLNVEQGQLELTLT